MNNTSLQYELNTLLASNHSLSKMTIHATCTEGVVKLTGTVKNFAQRTLAEQITKSNKGVQKIINEILVEQKEEMGTDDCIRSEIQNSFKNHWLIPHHKIDIQVKDGFVELQGVVQWKYQQDTAVSVARKIKGVKSISNKILVRADVNDAVEKCAVEEGLKNNWALDSQNIKISVSGNTVQLTGTVCTLLEKEQAEQIAWKTPGVWNVENNLVIDH